MLRPAPIAGLALLPFAAAVGAQAPPRELSAEFFMGTAWSLPLPVVVTLPDERIAFRARWSTRPLRDAPYYAYRAGGGRRGDAVEAELIHHKLYLESPPPRVEHLEVTHGYNLPLANVASPARGATVRLGLGLVVAHAEGRVAGRRVGVARGRRRTWLGGGYHLAGVAMQLAVGRRYPLSRGDVAPTVAPEVKLTASWARVPLEDGSILVPNVALHALGGVGVRRRW